LEYKTLYDLDNIEIPPIKKYNDDDLKALVEFFMIFCQKADYILNYFILIIN
jgi:hypothetical protein